MDILKVNEQLIVERIETGLSLLRERYGVEEKPVDPVLANPMIGGRPHHARRFEIENIGNLLAMTVVEAEENQLSSFVITPYLKDLPLFSTDYVYSNERRFFLIELYDLAVNQDDVYRAGVNTIASLGSTWNDMPDFSTKPCWYDDIRPVCIAKAPRIEHDDLALKRFEDALGCYLDMADRMPMLDSSERTGKWMLNKGYADRLIDEGGVSTDLFTDALGPENTRRFFDEVFFGPSFFELRE